ncbi:hypothetical protein ACFQ5N_00965 [Lutibacter holmesii]|uniref:PAS domain-containing protein n=1 Tax=Lutibacter holmesii TaxID=1137985 RepID=A0ABW3WM44_9FLAO
MNNQRNIEGFNQQQFNNLFNSALVNNLPYLFWMYELIGNEYKLIKWNKNQEIYTEYSTEELYHKNALDFFDDQGKTSAAKAITEIFERGSAKIFENLLTKSGKTIPYCFEGYLFNFGSRQIFIGISIDVSEESETKKKLKLVECEKERLLKIDQENKKELQSYTAKILRNNIVSNKLSRQVDIILAKKDISNCRDEILKLKTIIDSQQVSTYNWEMFQSKFDKVYANFFDSLKTKHPELTKSELQFCSFVKVQISIVDIASLLNISMEGVKKKKYRIRKKLSLNRSDSLELYLLKF